MNKTLDETLKAGAERRLDEPDPYPIPDARCELVRAGGAIASQPVLSAGAANGEGRRQVLAVALANCGRGSRGSGNGDFAAARSR